MPSVMKCSNCYKVNPEFHAPLQQLLHVTMVGISLHECMISSENNVSDLIYLLDNENLHKRIRYRVLQSEYLDMYLSIFISFDE